MSSSPTGEQDLTIQGEALTAAGCTIIREEKRSGTSREGQELETLLAFLRKGDVLMVTRIDRLAPLHARSTEYRSRAEGQGRGAQGD
jgi:DNA invertase Pin-like site-specific DNA recombinase